MHQSGHSRAHNMQDVQFSSSSAMTPRDRGGSSGRTCGYSRVTERFVIERSVTPSPCNRPLPGTCSSRSSWWCSCSVIRPPPHRPPSSGVGCADSCCYHPYDAGERDLRECQRHERHPGQPLQLVLAEPRVGDAQPDDDERQGERFQEQPQPPELVLEERALPAAEEEDGGQGGEH